MDIVHVSYKIESVLVACRPFHCRLTEGLLRTFDKDSERLGFSDKGLNRFVRRFICLKVTKTHQTHQLCMFGYLYMAPVYANAFRYCPVFCMFT